MSEQVVEPRMRGFISLTAHPEGCALNVRRDVELVQSRTPEGAEDSIGNALVIGSSSGYGLGALLTLCFGYGAKTLGVCFEKESTETKTGSGGWYNLVEAHRLAREQGRTMETVNGDAFSPEVKEQVVEAIRERFGKLDSIVYSLAAPRRSDPDGTTWNSVLKPIGEPYRDKGFDLRHDEVTEMEIEPASDEEIEATVKVMGGEDWAAWIDVLREADLLAEGCRTVAFSWIGPPLTQQIYRSGTIGRAKEHLERTAHELDAALQDSVGGHAWVSVNKGVVTQASSAIPVIPIYVSALFRVLSDLGEDETTTEQIVRLYADHLRPGVEPALDDGRRIRVDDREMRDDVQARIRELWDRVTTENLRELVDYDRYQREFQRLFGFSVEGVDYSAPTEVKRTLD
jgi:enoyl-[acyl-carrier protein] reductase/trans-2-enoyl-CoA reductase (NAD+)